MATPEPEENERLPKRLLSALRDQALPPLLVPRPRDDAALAGAKQALRHKMNRRAWETRIFLAVAAMLLIGALLWSVLYEPRPRPASSNPIAVVGQFSADLDGNGRVDIFDAFLVARALRDGQTKSDWDVNRDGVVDSRDVVLLSRLAVQLNRGTAR